MRSPKLKNTIYILSGLAVVGVGLIGVGVGILGIIDPVGTKLSDDNDPFGPPGSILWPIAISVFSTLIAAFGFWIISRVDKKVRTSGRA